MPRPINVTKLGETLAATLTEFSGATSLALQAAVTETAKRTVAEVKQNARSYFGNGGYSNSWAEKEVKSNNQLSFNRVVYSKPPYYRLAHLLEKGHALRQGGRTKARPHIRPAEEKAEKLLMDALQKEISRI